MFKNPLNTLNPIVEKYNLIFIYSQMSQQTGRGEQLSSHPGSKHWWVRLYVPLDKYNSQSTTYTIMRNNAVKPGVACVNEMNRALGHLCAHIG